MYTVRAKEVSKLVGRCSLASPHDIVSMFEHTMQRAWGFKPTLSKKPLPEDIRERVKKLAVEGDIDTVKIVEHEVELLRKQFKHQKRRHYSDPVVDGEAKDATKSPLLTREDIDCYRAQIAGIAFTTSGEMGEDEIVTQYEAKYKVPVRHKQENKKIPIWGNWQLSGSIDGIVRDKHRKDVIFEAKKRQKKLLECIYEAEKWQVQAYMHMWNLEKAYVVESYKDELGVNKEHRDRAYYRKVFRELKNVVRFMTKIEKNAKTRAKWESKDETAKYDWLNDKIKDRHKDDMVTGDGTDTEPEETEPSTEADSHSGDKRKREDDTAMPVFEDDAKRRKKHTV